MNILYFDCFSGISGDMTLAALLDLDKNNYASLVKYLKTLNLDDKWDISMERRSKNGIDANYIKVILDDCEEHHHEHHTHHHRNLTDIINIIDNSGISAGAKELAKKIFARLAKAEAKIHGCDIDGVNFHEVGAVDSIIDIVGSAILLDLLITQNNIEKIYSSPVSDGYGFTYCQHGKIPVPVPATAEIFSDAKVKTRQLDIPKEMVTPTGAAIIAEISGNFGLMPEMTSLKTGYGAGTRDLDIPNVVRVILGKTQNPEIFNISDNSYITVIETNIDDCSPEIIAYTLEKLLKSGANDVFFTPVYMKKNRPGVKLTVLCKSAPEIINKLTKIIFDETTTIGLRIREEKRICLKRESKIIDTKYGGLKIKEIEFNGEKKYFPEYESAKELAEKSDAPLYKIYESVKQKQIF